MSVIRYRTLIFHSLFLIAGFTISIIPAKAQLVQLNLKFGKDTIMIGERTSLRLDIISQKGVSLSNFALKDSLNKEIEILDSTRIRANDSISLELTVSSFKPGIYSVSGIPLIFTYENSIDTILSPRIFLTVLAPAIDPQSDIKDIKPILNLPFRLREILPELLVIALILLILSLAGIYLYRKFRKKQIQEEIEKSLPAHILANKELDKLKSEKLLENGKTKEFYSRLSDIMRIYLENRFGIQAMELVSYETINSFKNLKLYEDMVVQMLENILVTADLVKFAKANPLNPENQENLGNAYLFVEQTKMEEFTSFEEQAESMKQNSVTSKTSEE